MGYAVVDALQLDAGLTAIADAIREKTGGAEPLSFPDGMAAEVDAVFAAGKKGTFEEMDSVYGFFRDSYNRGAFDLFCSSDLSKIKIAQFVFQTNTWLTEFDCPATLDPDYITGMFLNCKTVRRVGGLGRLRLTVYTDLFNGCAALEDAGALDLSLAQYVSRTFQDCIALTEVSIIGPVTVSLDLHWSPLSRASIESAVSALSDASSGMAITLSLNAVDTAFETGEGAADGSASEEWLALVATKPNWTISLA